MNDQEKNQDFWVTLEPLGRRIKVLKGTTVLEAAQNAGVEVMAVCGGNGSCGTCKVLAVSGNFSPPGKPETEQLEKSEIDAGYRLACKTTVNSDCTIHFPQESLGTLQRLQLESTINNIPVHTTLKRIEVSLSASDTTGISSEIEQVHDLLKTSGLLITDVPQNQFPHLLNILNNNNLKASLVFSETGLIAILPPEQRLIGYAVDIGTTKIAGYLVDLQTGQTLTSGGVTNPQIAYGEDVISRIKFTDEHPQGAKILQKILVESINKLASELCQQTGMTPDQIIDSVMVGNTAMHHLLVGLPVHSLGTAPYIPSVIQSMHFPAGEIGLELAAGAYVYLPPNIAGFVGSDHIAMLLATNARKQNKNVIALDIGTNTEISLIHNGRHLTCSCASGPAFEGAHIRDGLRAISGAIERVFIDGEKIQVQTIQNIPAVGICGSGILDAVAEMRKEKLIDARGTFIKSDSRFTARNGNLELVLVPASQSGIQHEIAINRKDINEIQLAKAAIRSGIEVLMKQAHIGAGDIDLFFVAGAFGTYLDLKNALQI
ncbi:MAG: DUF4445 domain-containing protein, partial [Anaerolineaceae bacterium]|nr:DUF4445 domain-containing protein [Anaerolineaceae bacterium]